MREERCNSCGALMHLDENQTKGHCNYCGAEYNLNKAVNVNINFNTNTDIGKQIQKPMLTFALSFFVIIMVPIIIAISFIRSTIVENNNVPDNNMGDVLNNYEREMFNSSFEFFSGEQSLFFTKVVLERIVDSNLNYPDRQIFVSYKDKSYYDEDINTLKDKLSDKNYKLTFDYGYEGFIDELIISEEE